MPPRGRHAVALALALAAVTVGGASLVGRSGPSHRPRSAARTTTTTTSSTTTTTTPPTTTAPPNTTTRAPATTTAAPPAVSEWTTYGGGPLRDSFDAAEPGFSSPPGPAWTSPALDGADYGQPLIDGGRVYVATENDSVYALAAATGVVVWSRHLGNPVPAGSLPCGDITPTVGITSTMVLDPANGTLFASAALWDGQNVSHVLFGLAADSGAVRSSVGLDRPGWSAPAQLQRAALGLDAGQVLVPFGGNYGDCGHYHGWVVAVAENGGVTHAYQVPTANEGAIWGTSGPAVDAAGNVFVATGNGSANPGQPFDHGNAVIELSAALAEQRYWAPADWAQDNQTDADLGSTNPVLLGDGRLFIVGKQNTGYLLHTSSLGGVGGPASSVSLCSSRGANAYAGATLYITCPSQASIVAVGVGPGDALIKRWTWTSPTNNASSPIVARGLVWSIDGPAVMLYGINPANGATVYGLHLNVGGAPHFAAPSAGEGMVVVAGTNAVEAFR